MGNKTNPIGFRLGVTRAASASWYAEGADFARQVVQDLQIRKAIVKLLPDKATVADIVIQRRENKIDVMLFSGRPATIIGERAVIIEKMRMDLAQAFGIDAKDFVLRVAGVRTPELSARLVADNVAQQLEQRVMFRRAMRRVIQGAMTKGAQGVKVQVAGRLGGAEIARTEWYREGRVPLHTLRAQIDYALAEAHTTYGVVGVKVWIYTGERDKAQLVVDRLANEVSHHATT